MNEDVKRHQGLYVVLAAEQVVRADASSRARQRSVPAVCRSTPKLDARIRAAEMPTAREYMRTWLRWQRGRQNTGYDKLLLLANPFLLHFDLYLLRFPEGTEIPPHQDPVTGKRHYRLNIILKSPRSGGEFICANPIFETKRIKLFRSDVSLHSVSRVEGGSRYVLSLGWVLKGTVDV